MDIFKRWISLALAGSIYGAVMGQAVSGAKTLYTKDTAKRGQAIAKEAFVNQVFRTVVDSSFSTYRLSASAYPSNFLQFEYDEWVKYALLEDVPIYVLNELAGKSFADREPSSWQCDSLVHTICIDPDKADSVLDPAGVGPYVMNSRSQDAAVRRAWENLPPEKRTVFYFSRPLFTDDGNYALLDMDYRCDNRHCGMGYTCVFRLTEKGWRLVGKKQNW